MLSLEKILFCKILQNSIEKLEQIFEEMNQKYGTIYLSLANSISAEMKSKFITRIFQYVWFILVGIVYE